MDSLRFELMKAMGEAPPKATREDAIRSLEEQGYVRERRNPWDEVIVDDMIDRRLLMLQHNQAEENRQNSDGMNLRGPTDPNPPQGLVIPPPATGGEKIDPLVDPAMLIRALRGD